jgi:hypothetical protein
MFKSINFKVFILKQTHKQNKKKKTWGKKKNPIHQWLQITEKAVAGLDNYILESLIYF